MSAERGVQLRRIGALVLAGSVLVVLAAAFLVLVDARPASDDFALAARGRSEGVLRVTAGFYEHWSGRWALFVVATSGLVAVDPTRMYPVLLSAVWLVFGAGLAALVRTALGPAVRRRDVAAATAVLGALCFSSLAPEEVAETYYWFTGGVPYLASLGALFLVAGRLALTGTPRSIEWIALPCLAACATGAQEVVGLCGVLVLGALALHARLTHSPRAGLAAVCALAASLGFAVLLFAPGNAERALTEFQAPTSVSHTLSLLASELAARVWPWLLDPKLVLAAILVALRAARSASLATHTRVAIAASLTLPVVALAAALHVTGGWLPARLCASVAVLFDVALLATVHAAARGRTSIAGLARFEPLVTALLAVALLATGSGRRAIAEIESGRVAAYTRAIDANFAAARNAATRGETALSVPAPPSRPRLFIGPGLTPDPAAWPNSRYAEFFGLERVTADW